MPDLIRHPVPTWIPVEDHVFIGAFAGITILRYLIAGVITRNKLSRLSGNFEQKDILGQPHTNEVHGSWTFH